MRAALIRLQDWSKCRWELLSQSKGVFAKSMKNVIYTCRSIPRSDLSENGFVTILSGRHLHQVESCCTQATINHPTPHQEITSPHKTRIGFLWLTARTVSIVKCRISTVPRDLVRAGAPIGSVAISSTVFDGVWRRAAAVDQHWPGLLNGFVRSDLGQLTCMVEWVVFSLIVFFGKVKCECGNGRDARKSRHRGGGR